MTTSIKTSSKCARKIAVCILMIPIHGPIATTVSEAAAPGGAAETAALIDDCEASSIMGSGSAIFPDRDPIIWNQVTISSSAQGPQPDASIGCVIDARDAKSLLPSDKRPLVVYDFRRLQNQATAPDNVTLPNLASYLAHDEHLVFAFKLETLSWEVVGSAIVSAGGDTLAFDASGNTAVYSYVFIDPVSF